MSETKNTAASNAAQVEFTKEAVAEIKAENAALKEQVADLQSKLVAALSKTGDKVSLSDASDLVEIVYIPPEGVSTFHASITFAGTEYKAKSIDGFNHFWIPRKFAELLLVDRSCGVRYLLTGQDEPLVVSRRVGSATIMGQKVYPHSLVKTSKGEPVWKPVEVVESKDKVD